MDPIRAGRERPAAQFRVVVLADGEDRPAGGVRRAAMAAMPS